MSDKSQEEFNRQADVIQAFIAGCVFTLMISVVIAQLAR